MVAKYWLATGKALRPGYFRVNILDMHPDGQMFVTEDQVPNDVSLETLIHHLDMLRPANSKHNDHVLCNAYESIDDTVEMSKDHDQRPRSNFRRRRRRDAIKLRKSAQARYFKLVAPNSERGTWHHILHVSQGGSQTYKIPEGSRSLAPHLWKPLDGTAALVKIKKASQQGKLPVFVRPWMIRLRGLWAKIHELRKLAVENEPKIDYPSFTTEELGLLDDGNVQ